MRNYVVINGVSSLTIPGLAIKELPSISKPLMRNQKEEVDGRDGDIITELGYSAYDKTMTIGLYGSYDINQIIAFFNQKGTITFSDESEKYYNFTILEKIDYDKLVKFRTASVKFHCQPFKYPLTETPGTTEAEFVTGTGENLTLNNTTTASMDVDLKGNTYQETTSGKNLFDKRKRIRGYFELSGSITNAGYGRNTILYIPCTPSTAYSFSFSAYQDLTQIQIATTANFPNYGEPILGDGTNLTLSDKKRENYVTNANANYIVIRFQSSVEVTIDSVDINNFVTDFQVEKGSTATDYEPYTNGASPNPDYPQEVQVVTGDNTIKVSNKNLINMVEANKGVNSTGGITSNTNYLGVEDYIECKPNTTYTITFEDDIEVSGNIAYLYVSEKAKDGTFISRTGFSTSRTFTTGANTYYIFPYLNRTGFTFTEIGGYIQLEYGNQATTYTPHQEQNYEINLGTTELCKIGTYQDYLYKSGENWYKHTEIGKYTLTGSESIATTNFSNLYWISKSALNIDYLTGGFSDNFKYIEDSRIVANAEANDYLTNNQMAFRLGTSKDRLYIKSTNFATATDLQTWLTTHNTLVYYVLATPTEEQITNAELIEQLEAILNAVSYEDQTNISQDNDNLPFILDVSALKKGTNEITINNTGNIYSKPILNIKGNGTIGVHLNGVQVFAIDMSTYHEITIDMANLEAYEPNLNILLNRQVTGNYENFKLEPGNNTISLSGGFTEATVTRYIRWL